jgi:hypothetical protein
VPATFECSLDGEAWRSCTSSYPLAGLSIGSHHFEARAIDALGWVDQTPATYDWVVTGPPAADTSAPLQPVSPPDTPPAITTGLGAALLPVARVAPLGTVRLDRRTNRVKIALACRGPGPCAGRVAVLIRGLSVAETTFRIAAGEQKSFSLRLGRQGKRVLRRALPRTAAFYLTRSTRTSLGRSVRPLLTGG